MKFRSRVVIIEAEQWRPGDVEQSARLGFSQYSMPDGSFSASINTLEGQMAISPGDWIITGLEGERYPCKPTIFERRYEPWDPQTIKRPTIGELEEILAKNPEGAVFLTPSGDVVVERKEP